MDESDRKTDAAAAWTRLEAELQRWNADGRTVSVWWRDNDAVSDGPRLQRMFRIVAATGASLGLAAIPKSTEDSLAKAVVDAPEGVWVLQHGFAHVNHAPRGQGLGAWELGLHRGRTTVLEELALGQALLEDATDDRFLSVIVPPWNRIDPALFPALPDLGFAGVSAFGARAQAEPVPGLSLNHAHVDPVSWKRGERFAGTAKTLFQLIDQLQAQRSGEADAAEAVGILTHHAVMDEDSWRFTATLLERLTAHPAVRFRTPAELFPQ